MSRPVVFISYSHEDEHWKDLLLPQFSQLAKAGYLEVWDDRQIRIGDDWYRKIEDILGQARYAICLISAHFLDSSFCMDEEIPFLLERERQGGLKILPVLVHSCVWEAHDWLRRLQMLPRDGQALGEHLAPRVHDFFAQVARFVYQDLQSAPDGKPELPPKQQAASPPERVSLDRLPVASPLLFGRRREIFSLTEAWGDPATHLVAFTAWGGVGKSSLVRRWCDLMADESFRGARRVFAWSFYSQGTGERVTSADLFITSALEWFGEGEVQDKSWSKALRLAELIRKQKTLLLIDGIEPLQSGSVLDRGAIQDPSLRELLLELARGFDGLCVTTSREPLTDLKSKEFGRSVKHIDLEQVSSPAGRALLRVQGLQGSDAELERLVEEFGNHALAINLLAAYLLSDSDRCVSAAARIPGPANRESPVSRILTAFERRFEDAPEIEILSLLSLFDGPAEWRALRAIRSGPPIPGLTSRIFNLTEGELGEVIATLRRCGLIAPPSRHRPDVLDTHPLVREHFTHRLRGDFPEAWREGNNRLYEHLKRNTKEAPQTVDQMAYLVAAAIHGCRAGRYRDTLEEVYWERIRRENRDRSFRKFGAFGTDLVIMAGFFEQPWTRLVPGLDLTDQGFIFNNVGFCLRALGRVEEALGPFSQALACRISQDDWVRSAADAESLSEVYLALGEVEQALAYAEKGIALSEKGRDLGQRLLLLTSRADALHQAGRFGEAHIAFKEAERLQRAREPTVPFLYSLQGFQYCDLLLEENNLWEVQDRAEQALQAAIGSKWLLDRSLAFLTFGKALLLEAQQTGADLRYAEMHLKWAVDGLRLSDYRNLLPLGLLARADLSMAEGSLEKARQDLEEALTTAERGRMRLAEADCHLAFTRLYLQENRKDRAREHLARAREIVEKTGYGRRVQEINQLEQRS